MSERLSREELIELVRRIQQWDGLEGCETPDNDPQIRWLKTL